jgi:hypothetical protein
LKKSSGRMMHKFAIEIIVYAALVGAYFYLVLQFLGDPLKLLFSTNLGLYAVVALGLVVIQGIALEFVTSLIVRLMGWGKLQ